jgi:hypothetical protein
MIFGAEKMGETTVNENGKVGGGKKCRGFAVNKFSLPGWKPLFQSSAFGKSM